MFWGLTEACASSVSTALSPDDVHDIDEKAVSFFTGMRDGVGLVWSSTRQFPKYGEFGEFAASVGHPIA